MRVQPKNGRHENAGEQDLSTKEMLGEGNWETQGRVPTVGVIVQGQDSKTEIYPQLSCQQNE